MRRLLGVLRRGDEDLALAPQPSLARLDALVRHVGGEVRLRVEGQARAMSPGLDVAAYRVVEDALRAVLPAARADVVVRWSADAVALDISSPAQALVGDDPLRAIRERVGLFGGDLRSG